ncbi:hypothetical protein SLA2020_449730 [Shorea laevis]
MNTAQLCQSLSHVSRKRKSVGSNVLGDAVVFNFIMQKESVAVSQWSQKCQKQRLKTTKKKTLNIICSTFYCCGDFQCWTCSMGKLVKDPPFCYLSPATMVVLC